MADINKLSVAAMGIITFAGLAKSNYLIALKKVKEGNEEEALQKIQEGAEEFAKAHAEHSSLLTDEMNLLEPQVSLLLVHAEDQLMAAETIKLIVEELIEIYKDRRVSNGCNI
ncbi:PTS lactose/cellobiose transporter subunit IIA [Caldifermentibacillus hisashii]|uniref:PTS lactose/cellobiose transporter subunit IIA n=1 Tax=Caldifermentibacillus hisashii TaxID=996558 RepID=UPI003D1E86B9